jgi:hypothetical protein
MRDFAALRTQAIELLHREGRVAYRVLQLQIDDALLEVLKDDLIYAKRLAVDDEGKVLLAPIYGWFTEGFDTADLQEAKALLEASSDEHA